MQYIAICDDIAEHAASLSDLVAAERSCAYLETFPNASSLLAGLEQVHYDVVFLALGLGGGGGTGVAVAQRVHEISPLTQIVFVTGFITLVEQVPDAPHTYLLVKPVDPEKLRRALHKCDECLSALRAQSVLLPVRKGAHILVPVSDILYFERMRRVTLVNRTSGDRLETADRLNAIETLLPAKKFARPHNSYLVNLRHIYRIERSAVTLDNGVVLPISNQRRQSFKDALAASLLQ